MKPARERKDGERKLPPSTVLMLLTNGYDPDPRVRQEALSLIAMGCRVRLLAWDRDQARPAQECMEGVEVERIFLRSRHGRGATQLVFYFWLYLRLLWRGWRIPFEVVHCHDLDSLPIGFLLGKCKRKPIIYDAHEIFPEMLKDSVPRWLYSALLWMQDFLIRRVNLLITPGERMRQYFLARQVRRAIVVGNWKRLEEFSRTEEQNRALRHRLRIPDDALVVTFIANLSKEREIEGLLQAADHCPEVYVILGGQGVLQPLVRLWAAKNPRVLYLGFVPAWEIPAHTCAADVIYYGFDPDHGMARFSAPHKLFEALAAGKPILTGDFGEIAEVVRRTGCGIVLPTYHESAIREALERLRNKTLWAAYAHNARVAGCTEMNWGKAEEILYQEYSRLLATKLAPEETSAAAESPPTGWGQDRKLLGETGVAERD